VIAQWRAVGAEAILKLYNSYNTTHPTYADLVVVMPSYPFSLPPWVQLAPEACADRLFGPKNAA
jgi:hypothetical protein